MEKVLTNNNEIGEWKPMLSRDIRLTENGSALVLNQTKLGYQLRIDVKAKAFLQLMDGTKDLHELSRCYEHIYNRNMEADRLSHFLNNEFVNKGFIESDRVIKQRESAAYLKLKITLIPAALLNGLRVGFLRHLFKPTMFYATLVALILINTWVFVTYKNSAYQSPSWQVLLILFLSHLFHEFGHSLAAKSMGARPGHIGFGFYYVLPVFFVDLSDIWNLKKRERIIINLSGIYFDYITSFAMFLLFLATHNSVFIVVNLLLFFKTFYNINPLVRSDAYWVIADTIDKPNLTENAGMAFRQLCSPSAARRKAVLASWRHILLAVYGTLAFAFWAYIIIGLLQQAGNGFSGAIALFSELGQSLRTNTWNFTSIMGKLINLLLVCIALMILGKIIIQTVKRFHKKKSIV
jgi:putative peptide zinc metalloprotease protein